MPRERSPNRDKAKLMWIESAGKMLLKDIAIAFGLGETQIRKWKSQDKWDGLLNGNVTNQMKGNVTKRIGPPLGNKNAIGNKGGAPPGNQNAVGNSGGSGGPPRNTKAVTTGEYQSIWFDALTEEEVGVLDRIDVDPTEQVDGEIILLAWREREMMLRIQGLKNGLSDKQKRVLQQLKNIKQAVPIYDEKSGQTNTVIHNRDELVITEIEEKDIRLIDDILHIEEALTRIQEKKLKAIDLKYRIISDKKTPHLPNKGIEIKVTLTDDDD